MGGQAGRPWTPGNLGVFIISCQDGDIRMSEKGLMVYDNDGQREVEVFQPGGAGMTLDSEVLELYNAVKQGAPLFHDGRWGMATAEVQWGDHRIIAARPRGPAEASGPRAGRRVGDEANRNKERGNASPQD